MKTSDERAEIRTRLAIFYFLGFYFISPPAPVVFPPDGSCRMVHDHTFLVMFQKLIFTRTPRQTTDCSTDGLTTRNEAEFSVSRTSKWFRSVSCVTRTSAVPHRPRSSVATKSTRRPNASICSQNTYVMRLRCYQIFPFSKLRPTEINVFFILSHVRSNRTKAHSETSQTLFDHYQFCRKTKIVKKTITKRIGI